LADDRQLATARRARTVSLVIAGTMLLWLAAQWIGPAAGMPGRFAFLIDLAALAAFSWAMVNIYWIWRERQKDS